MTVQEWLGEDNKLGIDIWDRKYRYNNETFDEWLDRVSGGDQELRKIISERKFLFGGRTLANRNTGKSGSMSNCYSRGFCQDSLEDLMQTATDIAHTFKAQGGQGISLSHIRPKGTGIHNGQFKSDGIIPFMEIFNRVTESISQGGSRKGALLMSLDAWHKEAEDFIKIKSEEGKIQKANLSLEIDDDFMECVKTYYETSEITTKIIKKEYDGNKIEYEVTPIKLYKLMMEKAWDWGEPGCIFVSQFRNYNLMEFIDEYQIETCNPCGEQPLVKHGACNLGSINLSEFVKNSFTDKAYFDFEDFKEATRIAIIALDKVLDENKNNHALPEQREMAVKYRNVGLGITGAYDALVRMGIRYGSKQSVDFMDALMGCMFRVAVITSSKLAEEYGTFPGYKPEVLNSKIILKHFTSEELDLLGIRKNGLRNCSLLSIAPAGSIGTMLDVSTGCEPAFSISYKRKTESLNDGEDKYYDVYVGVAKQYLKMYPNRNLPSYFVTAADINWKDRINMQSALQKHVDTAISSTVNLNHDISIEEVEKLYLYAWQKKLKGVTIFRDGCKRVGILTTDNSDQVNEEVPKKLERGMIIVADENVIGKTRKLTTGCGNLWVRADFDPDTGDLIHCWLDKGSQGGCTSNYQGISRMISLAARGGIDIYSIVDQLKSVYTCPSYASRNVKKHDCSKGSSCPSAIGNALMDMYQEMQEELFDDGDDFEPSPQKVVEVKHENSRMKLPKQKSGAKCPECGHDIIFVGQCISCPECGWSKCE